MGTVTIPGMCRVLRVCKILMNKCQLLPVADACWPVAAEIVRLDEEAYVAIGHTTDVAEGVSSAPNKVRLALCVASCGCSAPTPPHDFNALPVIHHTVADHVVQIIHFIMRWLCSPHIPFYRSSAAG